MQSSENRTSSAPSRRRRSLSVRSRLLFATTLVFASGCGAREIPLDGAGSVNVNSNPDATAPGVTAFVEDQLSAMKIAVDDQRLYWMQKRSLGRGGVRSCLKSDGRSTPTVYDTFMGDLNRRVAGGDFVDMAAADDKVYWARQPSDDPSVISILTCPSAGCVGAPRRIASAIQALSSMAVDESHVYWTTRVDSAVWRIPVSGGGAPEAIALNETSPGQIVLSAEHVYWIERVGEPNSAIKRVSKRGGEPIATMAMAQNQAIALSVDSAFVYWATSYSLGKVLRCPLSGCMTEPEVIADHQPWISALVVGGRSASWITDLGSAPAESVQKRAAVLRRSIDRSDSPVETLAAQIFDDAGMSMAADDAHVYWVAQGLAEPMFTGSYPHATIYRHAN